MTPDQESLEVTKRTTLRLPEWLYDAVLEMAEENRRSLNQEIAHGLTEYIASLSTDIEGAKSEQLKAYLVGFLLAISTQPPEVEGFTEDQVDKVLMGVIEFVRASSNYPTNL